MSVLLENLQMMNEPQFKMLSVTVIVVITILTSCNSQRYYYKRNGEKYDIYYGATALDGFQTVKPPKAYEVSSELQGNKPGNCYNYDFRCFRPFSTSVTYIFECQVDYQCPVSYKCCQPRCFLHKVCQPSVYENLPSTPLKYQTTESQSIPITTVTSTTTEPTTITICTTEILTTDTTSRIETTTEISTITEEESTVLTTITGEISTTTETPLTTTGTTTKEETTVTTTSIGTTETTSSGTETTTESTAAYLTTIPESTITTTTTIETTVTTTEAPPIIRYKYLLDEEKQKFVLIGETDNSLMPKELPLLEKGFEEETYNIMYDYNGTIIGYGKGRVEIPGYCPINLTKPNQTKYEYFLYPYKDQYVLMCETNSSLIPTELPLFEKVHEEENSEEYPSSYEPKMTDTTDDDFKTFSLGYGELVTSSDTIISASEKEDEPVTITTTVLSSNIEENEKITTSDKEITVGDKVTTATKINEEVKETVTEVATVPSPITTKRIEETTTIVSSKENEEAIIEHSGDRNDNDDDDIEIITDKPNIKTTIDGFYFSVTQVDVLESAREKERDQDAEAKENDENVEVNKNHKDENENETDEEVSVTEVVTSSVAKTTETVIEDSGEGVKIRHENHKNKTNFQEEILKNEGNKEKSDDLAQSSGDGYKNEDDTGSGSYGDDDNEDDADSGSYDDDDAISNLII